jgi:hypothetical protein
MRNIVPCLLHLVILFGCSNRNNGELVFIEPDNSSSFNFPYFLYIPDNIATDEKVFVLIEPNNSGFADDDLQKHKEKAQRTATRDFYVGNYVARSLNIPLLVPIFPRTKTDWKIYTHALDRDAIMIKDEETERIDLQLLAMHTDARLRLQKRNIETHEKILMTGFSASGTFANRFVLIHPEKVAAVAAGGVNGLLMLPLNSINEADLIYPIGTCDFKELFNKEFQKELFIELPQFYFMGEIDFNDAIPYEDAFSQYEREIIFRLLGEDMHAERWSKCKEIYKENNVNAIIKTFKGIGHEHPESIKEEVVDFFVRAIGDAKSIYKIQ